MATDPSGPEFNQRIFDQKTAHNFPENALPSIFKTEKAQIQYLARMT